MTTEPDDLDGCAADFTVIPTEDADLAAVVLFADVDWDDPDKVAARRAEWERVFGG
jgi:hypothetical protein